MIHTNICCRVCHTELVVCDKDESTKEPGSIGIRRYKGKERKCNKCRKIPTKKGTKTLYLQADGSKKRTKDPELRYGLDADDIHPNELKNEQQIKSLYDTYTTEMTGDLPYETFKNKIVEDVIQGERSGLQF